MKDPAFDPPVAVGFGEVRSSLNPKPGQMGTDRETRCLGQGQVLLILSVACLTLAVGPSSAADPSPSLPTASPMARPDQAKAPAGFQLGDYELCFPPPAGWKKVEQPANSKIGFYSPDGKAVITVRVHPDTFSRGLLMSDKALLLMKRYPNAVKGLETPWAGAGLTGRQIEFTRPDPKRPESPLRFRLAVAPVTGGLLEVLFTAEESEFNRRSPVCDAIVRSIACTRQREQAEVAELPAPQAKGSP